MDDNGVKHVSPAADRATGRSGPARSARPRRAVPLAVPLAGPVAAPGGGSSFHMLVTPGSSLNPDSPRFQAANAACKAFSPFDSLTPAQQAVANAKALRYSRCMRSHGIGSYPDPNGHGTIQVP